MENFKNLIPGNGKVSHFITRPYRWGYPGQTENLAINEMAGFGAHNLAQNLFSLQNIDFAPLCEIF